LLRLGLFDETLIRNQDDELNFRIRSTGGVIWQSPRIVSWYRPRASLKALFVQYFQYGFWKVAVIRKHRTLAAWRHVAPSAAVAIALLLPVAAALAALAKSATWPCFIWPWATLIAIYGAGILYFSVLAARNNGWRLLPALMIVFPIYHLSYGLGFLTAIPYFFWGDRARSAPPRFSTTLSR